jgi:hypothetical protein
MRLSWQHARAAIVLLAAACLMAGCDKGQQSRIIERRSAGLPEYRSANLLLGADRTAMLATQIARSDWPATETQVQGPEKTSYVEYYSDFFGPRGYERVYPQRWFQSYRVGSSSR